MSSSTTSQVNTSPHHQASMEESGGITANFTESALNHNFHLQLGVSPMSECPLPDCIILPFTDRPDILNALGSGVGRRMPPSKTRSYRIRWQLEVKCSGQPWVYRFQVALDLGKGRQCASALNHNLLQHTSGHKCPSIILRVCASFCTRTHTHTNWH